MLCSDTGCRDMVAFFLGSHTGASALQGARAHLADDRPNIVLHDHTDDWRTATRSTQASGLPGEPEQLAPAACQPDTFTCLQEGPMY